MRFRSAQLTNHTLFLSEQEYQEVLDILHDAKDSISGEVVIGGSLSQRALRLDIAKTLIHKRLHDIDLVIPYRASFVTPRIKQYFYVMAINSSYEGYYFGLIHKKTKRWIDIFSEPYAKAYAEIFLGGQRYLVTTLESQILHLAHDIFWRTSTSRMVAKKWVEKLDLLHTLSHISWEEIEKEFLAHREYFLAVAGDSHFSDSRSYIREALSKGNAYKNPKALLSTLRNLGSDSVVTSNGITVDSRAAFVSMLLSEAGRMLRKVFHFLDKK